MTSNLSVGDELGRYRIEGFLGRGGMGEVYLAEQIRLRRRVALKVLSPDWSGDRSFRDRFIRESQIAAALDHPNIVPIYEADEIDGMLFLAMKYIDGSDLKARLRDRGPLEPVVAASIVSQIADALDTAHAHGLVHRDVKPPNILLAAEGAASTLPHAYLVDFGLAKRAESQSGLTGRNQFVGTVDYMAPEQVRSEPVDERTDVYALGCVLYECLSGAPPFAGREHEIAVVWAHLQEPPPELRGPDAASTDLFNQIVARAMAKSPEERFPTCGALAEAFASNAHPGTRLEAAGLSTRGIESQRREERKTVTVLFAQLSEPQRRDPEALRSLTKASFEELTTIINRHGGVVEQSLGNGVMALFGIPVVHEDDSLRAVRAAWEILKELEPTENHTVSASDSTLSVRIGIWTGEVLTTADRESEQPRVVGDPVTRAVQLAESAPRRGIQISETTLALVHDAVEVRAIEPSLLEGRPEDVNAFLLADVTPGAPGVARRAETPMVGRDRERAMLIQAFERSTSEESCHLFTIIGSAGVGKSRLVSAFVEELGEATVLTGRCLSYGDGITFWPLIEAIGEAAGIRADDRADVALAKVASLARGEDHEETVIARLAELLDLSDTIGKLEEQFWAVRRLFEHLSRTRPLVVVFDDIHWAEPTLLDLIEHIADFAHDARILVVCIAREELFDQRPGWGGGKFNATTVRVEPLDERESTQLIQHLLGQSEIAPQIRVRITEAAEGNPLFVEETLSMLIDQGVVRREDGRWVSTTDHAAIDVPPTIQALLAARIDSLRTEERMVLECASVVGKSFWRGAVRALAQDTAAISVDPNLALLVRKEMIRRESSMFAGEEAFRFRHQLIRDAAYGRIAKRSRADLHERFIEWLIGVCGDRIPEFEEILAHHYERAYRSLLDIGISDERTTRLSIEAGSRLSAAGRRASTRGDWRAAIGLFRRAVDVLPPAHPVRIGVLPDLAAALKDSARFDEAQQVIQEMEDLARETRNETLEWHSRLAEAELRIETDPKGALADARNLAAMAVDAFTRLNDERGLAKAWSLSAQASWFLMQAEETRKALEKAIEYGRRADSRANEQFLAGMLNITLILGPMPWDDAVARSNQVYRDAGLSRYLEAQTLAVRAHRASRKGDIDEARSLWRLRVSILEDLGMSLWVAGASQGAALIEVYAGDQELAAQALRDGADSLEKLGAPSRASTNLALLADIEADLGRYDEAERVADRARELGDELDMATQTAWRLGLAKVRAAQGENDEAERLCREALERVDPSDFLEYRAYMSAQSARVFARIGLRAEAEVLFDAADAAYVAKGVLVMKEKIRSLRAREIDPN